VRPAELERPVLSPFDLKALFVDGSVVPTTEQDQIRQRRGPTSSPMLDVVSLAEREITAGEAATLVTEGERAA
jgi:uncharacterized protein YgbK (DUF1537 family)